ncbi:MAG: hypothetical protein LAN64_13595 [Acidobacteriia bacterium]|nr:hypothetical protein [Terriglobia bacterium]
MRRFLTCAALAGAIVTFAQQQPITTESCVVTPPPRGQVEVTFENKILVLDGLKCTSCSFKNVTLLYSGGQYELKDATFSGSIAIELHGAAENGQFAVSVLSSIEPQARKVVRFDDPKTMSLKNM